jgi:hypothetical protein
MVHNIRCTNHKYNNRKFFISLAMTSADKRKTTGGPQRGDWGSPDITQILALLYQQVSGEGEPLKLERSANSIAAIARAHNETRDAVMRIHAAFEGGGPDAVKALRWGEGRPCKNEVLAEELRWLCDPGTLKIQAHLTMEQRAQTFNLRYSRHISGKDVRQLYKGRGITRQRFAVSLGPPKATVKSLGKQAAAL